MYVIVAFPGQTHLLFNGFNFVCFDTLCPSQQFYFDTQVGGGQDKLAWTAYPHP